MRAFFVVAHLMGSASALNFMTVAMMREGRSLLYGGMCLVECADVECRLCCTFLEKISAADIKKDAARRGIEPRSPR